MNIAYCEDEKIQLEYMEQLIRKWADEGNDTVTYFGYGSAKELLFEHYRRQHKIRFYAERLSVSGIFSKCWNAGGTRRKERHRT